MRLRRQWRGLTTEEVYARWPGWDFWRDGAPDGETPAGIATRLAPVLTRVRATPGRTLVFGHSHALRVLAARWLGLQPEQASIFALEPARVSELTIHRDRPVLASWNVSPSNHLKESR